MNRVECYQILGLPYGASEEEIKKAYKKLIMQWHPDRNKSPEANNKTKEINQAYEILTNSSHPYFSANNTGGIFNFGGIAWDRGKSFFSGSMTSSLTIELNNVSDAEKIIKLINDAGFKMRGYSIKSSNF